MSILNRRNAMIGWAVWQVAKRQIKKKARSAVPTGRPSVRGSDGGRGRKLAKLVAPLAALGGALWFWQKRRSDDDFPPPGAAY